TIQPRFAEAAIRRLEYAIARGITAVRAASLVVVVLPTPTAGDAQQAAGFDLQAIVQGELAPAADFHRAARLDDDGVEVLVDLFGQHRVAATGAAQRRVACLAVDVLVTGDD